MAYAMCPDEGHPRLYRYVQDGPLATLGINNLLTINRLKFDKLSSGQQHRLLRTQQARVETII